MPRLQKGANNLRYMTNQASEDAKSIKVYRKILYSKMYVEHRDITGLLVLVGLMSKGIFRDSARADVINRGNVSYVSNFPMRRKSSRFCLPDDSLN